MMEILTAAEMKSRDRYTIEQIGIPSAVLMERAACAAADAAAQLISEKKIPTPRVLAVCGSGNNGGDGIAVARILRGRGIDAEIFFAGNPLHMTEETARQYRIAEMLGIPMVGAEVSDGGSAGVNSPDIDFPGSGSLSRYSLIVDALFGIGLSRDVSGNYAGLIQNINESGRPVLSVDIPSGIDSDTGEIRGTAVRAEKTVTMQNLKQGLLLYPGAEYAGEVSVAEIGVVRGKEASGKSVLETGDLRRMLPARKPHGNKGTFGKVLLLAGSPGMAGAAVLAGRAALHSGCGMVKVLTHEQNRVIVQTSLPEALFSSWNTEEDLEEKLREGLKWADVVAAGPGLGTGPAQKSAVRELLSSCEKPLILDADALNLIAADERLRGLLGQHEGPVTVTPHIGEMARLTGTTATELKRDPFGAAAAFSGEYGVTCVLKDARTVTACPDGHCFLNVNGCSGMATAGSGDVLAGLTAGLIAQGAETDCAGALAAAVHGLAGEEAAGNCGSHFLTAGGMIDGFAPVMRRIFEERGSRPHSPTRI